VNPRVRLLLTGGVALSALVSTPARSGAEGLLVDVIRSDAGNHHVDYRVQAGDLVFLLKTFEDPPHTITFYSTEPPHPFLLRDRADLVPVLQYSLEHADGRDHLITRVLAFDLLPHIDDPKATSLFLRLHSYDTRGWELGPDWTHPAPDDSLPTHAWTHHIGDNSVLQTVEELLARDEHDAAFYWDWLPKLLATSDSPRALELLRHVFMARRDEWPSLAAEILPSVVPSPWTPTLPIAQKPMEYLISDVLPQVCEELYPDSNGESPLGVWWRLCCMEPDRYVSNIDYAQVRVLAERYLKRLLRSPDFTKLLVRPGVGGRLPVSSKAEVLAGFRNYVVLFEVCERFGTESMIEPLTRATAEYEEILRSPEGAELWPFKSLRYPMISEPPFEDAVEIYQDKKTAATLAMRNRSGQGDRDTH